MSILRIRPAKRCGAPVIIGISGQSGTGKTLTALYIARGMVDRAEQIGFLDTENQRGSYYSDELDGPFMIADLFAPFSPDRYAHAIKEFQDAGVKVLVIDSVTHEWEGTGGCMEIADNLGQIVGWNVAKMQHKRYMNVLLQSSMHIICCIRARQKMDFKNPNKPVDLGIQPVCEKNFIFEMTASITMWNEGKNQSAIKIPKGLRNAFGDGNSYLGIQTGKEIISWVNTGDNSESHLSKYRSEMQMKTSEGIEALKEAWLEMPRDIIKEMKPFWPQYEEAAMEFDSQRPEVIETEEVKSVIKK